MHTSSPSEAAERPATPDASWLRVLAGGVLMGLANLVPGVSGGTMILALGLYDRFIEAVSALARLRFAARPLLFVAVLGAGLVLAVVTLATPAVWLVTHHRWLAYSLFIGMTLGGVPMLWRVVRPLSPSVAVGALAGFGLMAVVAFGLQDTVLPQTFLVFLVAGALAASSMILPGVSGSYILLILGLYDVVIASLRPGDLLEEPLASLGVVVPVVIGAALGIGLLSNFLRIVLDRFQRPSHAVLLGLLVGSVLGLWPFQGAVHPELVDETRRDAVAELVGGAAPEEIARATGVRFDDGEIRDLRDRYQGRSAGDLELLALQLRPYRPTPARVALALLALVIGFLITRALGDRDPHDLEEDPGGG